MTVTVSSANDDEIREILRVMFRAYEGNNTYINAVFPRGLTDEGLERTYQRLLFVTKNAPGIKWEKATDSKGEIVGGTMWAFHEHTKPAKFPLDGPAGTWENNIEKEYGQALFKGVGDDEEIYWVDKELPIMRLVVLAVDPPYQRKGVGTELVRSGLTFVDNVGAITTVIATPAGKGLYEKNGFTLLAERDLTVPEKFADRPKYRVWTLARGRSGR